MGERNILRKLTIVLISFLVIYLIISFGVGAYVNVDRHKLLMMEVYNLWINWGTIGVVVLFSSIILVWQRGDTDLDSLLKKSVITPFAFFILLYLISFLFPDSYRLDVTYMNQSVSLFDYHNLQSGTSITSERYQPSQVIRQVVSYVMVAVLFVSIVRYIKVRR